MKVIIIQRLMEVPGASEVVDLVENRVKLIGVQKNARVQMES